MKEEPQMATNTPSSPFLRFLFIGLSLAVLIAATGLFAEFLSPVLLALFLAIILTPVFHWLTRKGMPNGLALLIMIVASIVIGVGLIIFLFLSFKALVNSLSEYAGRLQELEASVQTALTSLGLDPSTFSLTDLIDPQQIITWLTSFLSSFGGLLFMAIFVGITIMFAMLDATNLKTRLELGLGTDNPMLGRVSGLTNSMVRYILARTLVNLFTGTAVAIMLLILGVDFAILWGVLTFFLSYIPYIGIFMATVPSVLLALFEGGVVMAIVVIVGVSIINVAAENLVAPKIIGQGLSISPLVVFIAFFFWSWLLGPLGMLLSMPATVLIIFILNAFDETRWVALAISSGPGDPEPDSAGKAAEESN
jgi:predicted PurR-regulated permease PerM